MLAQAASAQEDRRLGGRCLAGPGGHSLCMRAALSLLMYFAAMALGGLLMANLFHPALMPAIADFLAREGGRWLESSLSVVLLLCPLAIWLRWLQVMRRAREISYQTENGRISVSLQAIEEALTRALEGEPEVKKGTVRVHEDRIKRSVEIEAVVTLWEVPNVTDRNRFCQRLLRRRFAELMPEQTDVHVNLSLHRLTMRRPESVAQPALEKPAAKPATDSIAKRGNEPEQPYRDPLLDSALLPTPASDELYVGPSYPVVKEEEDEASQYFARPAAEKQKGAPKK
jgi:hypothetical protein